MRVIFDLIFFALLVPLAGVPLAAVVRLHGSLGPVLPAWALPGLLVVDALALVVLMLCAAWLVRLAIGRLRPGRFPFPRSGMAFRWGLLFALQRVVYLPLWKPLIFGTFTLRYLFFRALGARFAFRTNMASDAQVLDASLHTMGPDSMLAAGSIISGHMIERGHLVLGAIRMGRGVQVMEGNGMACGVVIGDGTVVGPECRLGLDVTLGARCRVGMMCVISGGVTVGDGCVIGNQVTLKAGVTLGDGAVVRSHCVVPRGTAVPAGGRFPPAEAGGVGGAGPHRAGPPEDPEVGGGLDRG